MESFGGGVATAVEQYAAATPELQHYLLRRVRTDSHADGAWSSHFAEVLELPRSFLKARQAIKNAVREFRPDVVHAHSSFAGAFVRTTLRSSKRRPTVYTPHGFAFERADVSEAARLLFRLLEAVLASNTEVVAACSTREARLARFSRRSSVVYVPNVVNLGVEVHQRGAPGSPFCVTGFGRLTPAREPEFFVEVAKRVLAVSPEIRFVWIGGGERRYLDLFGDNAIEVTGWLPRDNALALFRLSDLHLHSAAWDGFPMVLLESNALRIPSLVRKIPAFEAVPDSLKFVSPASMADAVIRMYKNSASAHEALNLWDEVLSDNLPSVQRARLLSAYRK